MVTQSSPNSFLMATESPGGGARGGLEKGTLTNLDKRGSRPIAFLFNPTEYTISKSNSWPENGNNEFDVPQIQFGSGGPITLSMELFFDTYQSQDDVRKHTSRIFELTLIDKETGQPPRCMFTWGKVFNFPAVIERISVRFTLFLPTGTPVRATVSLSLKQCQLTESRSPQNPTSQGTYGNRMYVVKPGDTIDRIAYDEYGDPGRWRFLADSNGIDDPFDLRPGQTLAIHPVEI